MKEKILLALADKSLVSILSSRLAKEGYMITLAQTGDEALQKMHADSPDILLIDLLLPGKNGYDVLTEKTLDRLITKIPALIISNSSSTVDMKRIPSTPSIKGYVIKTHVDPEEVVQKVCEIYGHSCTTPVPAAPDQKTQAIKKKILWVEDDKFLGSILFKKFESMGLAVLKATDGDEALHILETEVPDLIILDIMLPGMSGFDILQKIKMNEKLRLIPVMMLSNLNKQSDIEKATTLGAQKFLVKAAVSLDEIKREVDSLLKI